MKKIPILLVMIIVISSFAFSLACSSEEEKELTEYTIDAVLDSENMTITAEQEVKYVNNYECTLDSIYFHLYPVAYSEDARFSVVSESEQSEAYPNGVNYGGIEILSVKVNGEETDYEITGVDQNILAVNGLEIDPTESQIVDMEYVLTIPEIRHRFGYYNDIINLGNWYPIASIYEDEVWRSDPYYSYGDPFYSEVADYNVSITVPTGTEIAGTGNISTAIDGDSTTSSFVASNVRDFALVLGENLTMAESELDGVKLRYYYENDSNAEKHTQLIGDAISTFNELFGKYPYTQLSVVQTNFMQGGMEYPQLVYISNELSDEMYIETIIHEIAHQWWYGVVGSDSIREAWMDEGLTEYATSMFYEMNPDYGVSIDDRIADAMKGYVLFNEVYQTQITDTSMSRSLDNYFSSMDYVYHTYVKGALLFDSLRQMIGDDAFTSGLQLYYSDYAYCNAKRDDLVGAFESTSNVNLDSFFSNWLDGKVSLFV